MDDYPDPDTWVSLALMLVDRRVRRRYATVASRCAQLELQIDKLDRRLERASARRHAMLCNLADLLRAKQIEELWKS